MNSLKVVPFAGDRTNLTTHFIQFHFSIDSEASISINQSYFFMKKYNLI